MAGLLAGCQSQSPAQATSGPLDPVDVVLAAALRDWHGDTRGDLRGIVVMRSGRIVAERYDNGASPDSLNDIRSAGKSVTALLATLAVERGAIPDIDAPLKRLWPASSDTAVGEVPLSAALTMQSGLDAFDDDPASPGNENKMDEAPDPIAFALAVPRAQAPGLVYRYNSLTAYLVGVAVTQATGQRLSDFADVQLFRPLGITQWRWAQDKAGQTKGQGNLWLSARSMARIGELVRCEGRYRGNQLVSAAGIAALLAPRVPIGEDDPYADSYGRFWYFKALPIGGETVPVHFASGNGGNKIYVIPTRNLVVAITSSAYGQGYGQRRSQAILQALLTAAQRGAVGARSTSGSAGSGSTRSSVPSSATSLSAGAAAATTAAASPTAPPGCGGD
ncbi:serine hydrolase domain-containing protein [Roseateles amylovorans]|uniref:Beta-lactamase family protein n=1 Tax=Roseateles amylovorans TaxID=2978473 RepID=A0ABY6AWN2_9BURK|nr:serine hydrolase [Roseateles amylovorans]UXH77318.1 beta-lactamase family protein [Roseateles amylovorans]